MAVEVPLAVTHVVGKGGTTMPGLVPAGGGRRLRPTIVRGEYECGGIA